MTQAYFGAQLQRNKEIGTTETGSQVVSAFSTEGHQEVAIRNPTLPQGSVSAESLTAVYQIDGTYGVNSAAVIPSTRGSGAIAGENGMTVMSTGTTVGSQASISSRMRMRARAGQGILARLNAIFSTPLATSLQLVGIGHAEDGIFFGYLLNTVFSVVFNRGGIREIRTLTITTASSTTQSITVTLNGVAHSVPVTNSGNINRTVWEIATYTGYTNFRAVPMGATVIFIANNAGANAGAFSISGTTVVGSFATTRVGAMPTQTLVTQANFNVDKLDGTGRSGFTLDPTKGNMFQIGIQDIGFGSITLSVMVPRTTDAPIYEVFHRISIPNSMVQPEFITPSFALSYAVASVSSTTNLTLSMQNAAGFIEGQKISSGNRYTYLRTMTSVTTAITPLFTIMNNRTYRSKSNQGHIYLRSLTAATKHQSPVIIYVIKNSQLTGNPVFATYDPNSCSLYDTAATGVTIATPADIIWSGSMGETGNIEFGFDKQSDEIFLAPGEWITIASATTFGTANYVVASINTVEDI